MPAHRSAATPAAVTSSTSVVFPKPVGLADGDWWYVATGVRGSVTFAAPPSGSSGFEAVTDASGTSGSTTASNVRAAVYRKLITNAAGEPGSVTLTGSVNVFGMPFSWAVSGAGVDISDFIALLTADSDSNASVVSPAVTPSDAGSLVYRLMFMNFPTAGAASGIITPADATEAFISPSMPSGTQRVSGGLAYEAGPGAGVSTGTEAWTVGGAEWGPAVGITIAIYPPSINTDAGDDQTVAPGTLVTLDPSGTVGADTREWDLISGTYPAAHLIPGVGDTLSFIAPTGPADLTFQLTATAGAVSGTDSVDVHVTAGGSGLRVGILGVSGQADYL